VSFILNINEVDVTPSRENVIWNTKTREAVKEISAKKTDLIEDKIRTRQIFLIILPYLQTSRTKHYFRYQ
jgi:hypothetical protein